MTIKKGINAIYLMQIIDALAFSVSGIFIPILILQNGHDFQDVILYFITHNLVLLVGSFAAAYLATIFGLKKVFFFRYPFLFFYLLFLTYFDRINTNIYLLAFAGGLQAAFYYIPLNILFARHTDQQKIGGALGKLMALPQIAGLAGPLLGGLIAYSFGFNLLFAITFVISLGSLIPLLIAPKLKDHFNFQPQEGFKFFKKNPKLFFSEIIDNISGECEGVIWPIFVFLTVKNVIAVGSLGTLVAIGSAVFTYLLGKHADKKPEKFFMRLAVPLLMLNWLLRFIYPNGVMVYVTSLLAGIFTILLILPYTRLTFSQAKRDINENFFVIKEVPTVIGRLLLFGLALIFAGSIKSLFPLAGLSYLYFLFL